IVVKPEPAIKPLQETVRHHSRIGRRTCGPIETELSVLCGRLPQSYAEAESLSPSSVRCKKSPVAARNHPVERQRECDGRRSRQGREKSMCELSKQICRLRNSQRVQTQRLLGSVPCSPA